MLYGTLVVTVMSACYGALEIVVVMII